MKKFKFSLETVLDFNTQLLDNKKSEYAQALQLVAKQQKKLKDTIDSYNDLNKRFRQAEIEGMTIAEAMGYESGLRVLEYKIKQEQKQLEVLEEQAEIKREELVESRKETMKLEKLKEKNFEDYKKQEIKTQELLIDELVSLSGVVEKNKNF